MDTLSLLIVGNLITLAIALVTVAVAQSLSNERAFRNAADGIAWEITLNEGISLGLLVFIKLEDEPMHALTPFPRYRTAATDAFFVNGFALELEDKIREKLEGVYMQMLIVNDAAARHERLSYGVESAMSNVSQIRRNNLALVKTVVESNIRPILTDLKSTKFNRRSSLNNWFRVQ